MRFEQESAASVACPRRAQRAHEGEERGEEAPQATSRGVGRSPT
jgi:hypothetical protein